MKFLSGLILFFLPLLGLFPGARSQNNVLPPSETNLTAQFAGGQIHEHNYDPEDPLSVPEEPSRAEVVLSAIKMAYPDRIRTVEFYDGDWTIVVYNERFFWADGRLLPEHLRHRAEEYSPLGFYNYPAALPPFAEASPEENARMREQEVRRLDTSIPVMMRSPHFFDTLWRSRNRVEAWDNVKTIRFLGISVTVHYSILTQLSLVEQRILRLANTNTAVRRWVDSIRIVEGWGWRDIAQTQNRSYHAYGAAIDILPQNLGNQQTYWLWSSEYYPEWWNIPHTRRYHPPEEVIQIFESFGFIWGGKWARFDTMHFEYRPEILILNGIPLMNLQDLD